MPLLRSRRMEKEVGSVRVRVRVIGGETYSFSSVSLASFSASCALCSSNISCSLFDVSATLLRYVAHWREKERHWIPVLLLRPMSDDVQRWIKRNKRTSKRGIFFWEDVTSVDAKLTNTQTIVPARHRMRLVVAFGCCVGLGSGSGYGYGYG